MKAFGKAPFIAVDSAPSRPHSLAASFPKPQSFSNENHVHPRLSGRPAAARGQLQMVGRQFRRRLRLHRRRGRDRCRHHRLWRGLPAGPGLPAGLCRGRARRPRGDRAEAARPRPDATRPAQPAHGRRRCAATPTSKSAIDVACWDILGKAAGPAGRAPCSAAAMARTSCSIAPSRRRARRTWRKRVHQYRAEGYTKFQLKVGGDPDDDIERIRAAARSSSPATS